MRVLLLITIPLALWAQQPPPNGDAQNGKKLFEVYGCYECHGHLAQGGGAGARLAPKPMPFAAFSAYVRHPTDQMPPFTAKVVSDKDLADIYAFLQSIPGPPAAKDLPQLKNY
jgi:mono/diheme cytochrome c family protein